MQKILFKSLLLLFSILTISSNAQNGFLKGVVKDKATGEAIIGANVVVEGTSNGVSTDLDGKYTLSLKPGTYNIVVTYISYKEIKHTGVKIEQGKVTSLSPSLEEDVSTLNEVTIVAKRATSSETAVIAEVKEAEQVVSAISAEQINKSQDRDAAQVMTRVPGVTVVENRFVIVRGLSERYNSVMINDAIAPSTEADKRSFAFDLIPSNMLDRMLVMKSGSADLPGDFAGGVIKIYTKNIPDSNFVDMGISSSYRTNTTFNNFITNKVGSKDWMALGSSDRSLASSFPATFNQLKTDQKVEASKLLPNTFSTNEMKAPTDTRFNINVGRKYQKGSLLFGTINSLSYTNTYQYQQTNRMRYLQYDPIEGSSVKASQYVDDEYDRNVRIGLISNWSAIVKGKHTFDFKNMFNQNGVNETTIRNGVSYYQRPDDEFRNYSFRYSSRSYYSGQLSGKHDFNKDKSSLKWVTGYSYINSQEPDFRRFRTVRKIGSNDDYKMILPPTATTFDAARFFSNLNESTVMNSVAYEHKLGKTADSSFAILRTGYYLEQRDRQYAARWMSYVYPGYANPLIADSLSRLPFDQVFADQNIKAKDGFRLSEGTNPSDKYTASNTLKAGYLSVQIPTKLVDVSFGSRVENNVLILNSATNNGPVNVNLPLTSILPFANAAFTINKKMLIRAAYSKTLNRPEFREVAPFLYYNFGLNFDFVGNPNLKVATVHNMDLRWEYYPTAAEAINFGVFYKRFQNPIENYIRQGADNPIFTYDNALYANSYGVEAEVRKSLYSITQSKFLQNFSVVFNGSLIRSYVDLGTSVTSQAQTRIMQGQSPFILNAGVFYNDAPGKTSISVMYNVYGKRIFTVGDNLNPTIYEMPRHMVDLTVQRKLGKNLDLKLGIQDILNYKARFTQDSNQDNKITKADEDIFNFRRGAYVTAGLTWRL